MHFPVKNRGFRPRPKTMTVTCSKCGWSQTADEPGVVLEAFRLHTCSRVRLPLGADSAP